MYGQISTEYYVFISLWKSFFKLPMDEYERNLATRRDWFRDFVETAEWYRLYDFVEFVAQKMTSDDAAIYTQEINEVLESENSGYRLTGGKICQITHSLSVDELKKGIMKPKSLGLDKIKNTFEEAMKYFSHNEAAPYESVLNTCKRIFELLANELGQVQHSELLTMIDALKQMKAPSPPSKDVAEFVLVTTAAYINLCLSDAVKKGLISEPEKESTTVNMWGERR